MKKIVIILWLSFVWQCVQGQEVYNYGYYDSGKDYERAIKKRDKWREKMREKVDKGDVAAMYELAGNYSFSNGEGGYNATMFTSLVAKADAIGTCPECRAAMVKYVCRKRAADNSVSWEVTDRFLDANNCNIGSLRLADLLSTKYTDSAIYILDKAAMRGDSLAMYRLGEYYEWAGNKKWINYKEKYAYLGSVPKAKFWYQEAARKGIPMAVEKLELYRAAADNAFEKGLAAYNAKKYDEAKKYWYADSRLNNNPSAMYNLGILYYNRYISGNYNHDAAEWFKDAGDDGLSKGYYMQAMAHWSEMEYTRADAAFRKGITAGSPEAKAAFEIFNKSMDKMAARDAEKKLEQLRAKNRSEDMGDTDASSGAVFRATPKKVNVQKFCSSCGGSGKTHSTIYGGAKGPGGTTVFGEYSNCSACGGKGYTN